MPMRRDRYPSDWEAISRRIRERAGQRCEQCGCPNGATIIRSVIDPARYVWYDREADTWRFMLGEPVRMSELPGEYAAGKEARITLTVAHLDHDTMNNADDNLKALCNRCHLVHDGRHHAANARRTRATKKAARLAEAGQGSLFEEVEGV